MLSAIVICRRGATGKTTPEIARSEREAGLCIVNEQRLLKH